MRGFYSRFVLPTLLDHSMQLRPFERLRQQVVSQARGHVLEIGSGSGLSLPHYRPEQVSTLIALDPSPELHARAEVRANATSIDWNAVAGYAEALPFPDGSFDCVVMMFTLCSVHDPTQTVKEIQRVLTKNGILLFAEHGAAPQASVRRWQERLNPVWRRLAGGCHLNRSAAERIEEAGFDLRQREASYAIRPHWLGYMTWGRAHKEVLK